MNAPECFDKNYFLKFKHDKSDVRWQHFYQRQILVLKKILGDNLTICDVGCGMGAFLLACENADFTTYGVDISHYAIREAKNLMKAKLTTCDIQENISFDCRFDVVTCFDVIEHLEFPEQALINMCSKLKNGGILLLTTPNLKSRYSDKISGWSKDKSHISLKNPWEWLELLNMTGFKTISISTEFPVLQYQSGIKALGGKLLARIGFGSTLIIIARKEVS